MDWPTAEPALMIQKDLSIWLEADHPEAGEIQEKLSQFAELAKSPGHLHLYRITPIALWNAAAAGIEPAGICRFLHVNSRLGLPQTVGAEIKRLMERYGVLRLLTDGNGALRLEASGKPEILDSLSRHEAVGRFFGGWIGEKQAVEVKPENRGQLKQELTRIGYPVLDLAGFLPGEPLVFALRTKLGSGAVFSLRDYQVEASAAFTRRGYSEGSGVLVLPCGAGKTVVGLAVMKHYACETLILTPNSTSASQWKRELMDKTTLEEGLIGEYGRERKDVRPVTIVTYQMLTRRGRDEGEMPHMSLFASRNWGLIIYDEVHLLPAPVFRMTAGLQSKRRLGLTATLIREDGHEADVFSLVGPKRYEAPWKRLEKEGWLARVRCTEVRVPFDTPGRQAYMEAAPRERIRVAGENGCKLEALRHILEAHREDRILIIGQYLDQLRLVAEATEAPLVSGEMPHEEREEVFRSFREGGLSRLVVSKVANFAVDLPDASVAVQISGSFGSRQEEAQRMGRILRPKKGANEARFYTLVTEESREQDFAVNRQLFLVEQGYQYEVTRAGAWNRADAADACTEGEVL